MIRRLSTAVLMVVFGLITGGVASGTAALPTAAVGEYAYDAQIYGAPETYAEPERGPRVTGYATTYDTVDPQSDGASERQSGARSRATYNYDDTRLLVQGDIVAGTTSAPAKVRNGDLSAIERTDVAAKGVPDFVGPVRESSSMIGNDPAFDPMEPRSINRRRPFGLESAVLPGTLISVLASLAVRRRLPGLGPTAPGEVHPTEDGLLRLSRGRGEDRVDVLVNVTSEPLPAPSALVDGWDVLHSVVVGSTVPGRSTLWVRPS